jgi:predicted Rossmann-fold nucleotide-binding protein
MSIRSIKTIAVFCGSNFGATHDFANGARALGKALGREGIGLVYGGTTRGLMGVVADAVLEAGGTAHGVITESLHQRGHFHPALTTDEAPRRCASENSAWRSWPMPSSPCPVALARSRS